MLRWRISTFWWWNHERALAAGCPNIALFPAGIEKGADVLAFLVAFYDEG
jgi:hypothetical protein